MSTKAETVFIGSILGVLALFSVVGYVFWTVVPQLQGREYLRKAAVAYTPDVIIDDKFIFEPMTNAQGLVRYMLIGDLIKKFAEQQASKPDPLFDKATEELEAYVTRFPFYYDYFVMLGKAYEAQSIMRNDPTLLKVAEKYYLKALEVAPGRQDALYAYSINLISQERPKEALALLREVVAKYPNLPDNHYQMAQALVVIGKDKYDAALPEFETALDGKANLNPPLTLQIYQKFLFYYYHAGDAARLRTVVKRMISLDPAQAEVYAGVVSYIEKNGTVPALNIQESN